MVERISGHVMPVTGRQRPPQHRLAVPLNDTDNAVDVIEPSELSTTLDGILRKEPAIRTRRVLSAHLAASELQVTAKRRWLPLRVRSTLHPDTHQLTVHIPDGQQVPRRHRERVAEYLAQLAREQPDTGFVRALRAEAQQIELPSPSPEQLLEEMHTRVQGLDQLKPELRGQHQKELVELLEQVEEWREHERASEVSVEPLTDPEQHRRALLELIQGAERQLVLACPWIRYEKLQELLDPLRRRLREGIQVFLLWGIARDEELPSAVRTALQNLTRDFPTQAFVSLRSSHSHAKLALQDDRQALVTSLNFLRTSAPSTVELGVLLRPAGEGPCPPIERLLHWARETYPEYRIARAMYVTHGDFNRTRRAGRHSGNDPAVERVIPPEEPPDGEHGAASVRMWQQEWQERFIQLQTTRYSSTSSTIVSLRSKIPCA